MCRWLTYVGPSIRLDRLLLEPDHSLVAQSHSPREMRSAVLNADGFGVAWYTHEEATPALYRSAMPMWSDDNLPRMAPHLRSWCVVANVRSATPGIGIALANTQPFVHGSLAFTHNGFIHDFRHAMLRPLRRALSDDAYHAIEGTSDSEHVFAHLLETWIQGRGRPLVDVVRRSLTTISQWVEQAGTSALLNIAVGDGEQVVAARHAVGDEAPTLYVRDGSETGQGTIVSSERPFEDSRWRLIDSGEVLVTRPDRAVETYAL